MIIEFQILFIIIIGFLMVCLIYIMYNTFKILSNNINKNTKNSKSKIIHKNNTSIREY